MSYTFLDSSASVVSADSSVVSGVTIRPIIQIGSVLSAVPVISTGGTSSVSGTVGASVIGTVPVVQSGSWTNSVVGTVSISSVGGAVLPYSQLNSLTSGSTSSMVGTTSTQVIASPGASLFNYITQILATNSHATVGTFIRIQDGSGGSTIYEGYAAAAGGGFSVSFPAPLKQPTSTTGLFAVNVTTGASTVVSASGFKA